MSNKNNSLHIDEDVASNAVVEFAAWLRNSADDDRNVSEIVRRLRAFWNDAFQTGARQTPDDDTDTLLSMIDED